MAISQGPVAASAVSSDSDGGGGVIITATLSETFAVSDTTTALIRPQPLRESFLVDDAQTVTIAATLSESFVAGDIISGETANLIRESFEANDTPVPKSTIRVTARSTAEFSDQATGTITRTHTESESLAVNDTLLAPTIGASLTEVFSASDTTQTAYTTGRTVREQFAAFGRALPRKRATLNETFVASARHTITNYRNVVYRETFEASDTVTPQVTANRRTVREVLKANDAAAPVSRLRQTVADTFFAYDHLFSPASTSPPATIGTTVPLADTQLWTADMLGWAMSRYVGIPVNDFVGSQFGAGRGGLYTYSADPVMAFFETGDMPLLKRDELIHEKKRLNYLYIYGTASDSMTAQVTADYRGARASYDYTGANRSGSNSRAMRIQLGRGFATNFAKIRVGGAVTFDTQSLELETTVTSRRV